MGEWTGIRVILGRQCLRLDFEHCHTTFHRATADHGSAGMFAAFIATTDDADRSDRPPFLGRTVSILGRRRCHRCGHVGVPRSRVGHEHRFPRATVPELMLPG